jgi:hypothetical protein
MRASKLLFISTLAMLALGAVGASAASAEGDGEPSILILSGNVSELESKGEAKEPEVITVLGNTKTLEDGGEIEGKKETPGVAVVKGCKPLGGTNALDTNLCEGLTTLRGVHIHGTTTFCRSETLAGVKDALGIVLVKGVLQAASEKSTAGVLEPLGIAKVLSVDGTSPLEITCGVIKVRVSGRIGCLGLPGLTETESGEVLCKTTKTAGDQETGTCETPATVCKELKEDPFLAGFTETEKVDAALLSHVLGKSNKPVFDDD